MSSKGNVFHSAGVPWYDALFGRDSIISAIQLMPYEFGKAKSTLRLLALYQGKEFSDWKDEEPGKILHELRVGEKANLNLIPMTPYYGTVDATPLYLILLAEQHRLDRRFGIAEGADGQRDVCPRLDGQLRGIRATWGSHPT